MTAGAPVPIDTRTLRAALLSVALPILALITACGGGGGKTVALDDWVDDLCDAAGDFQKASDKAGEEFQGADFDDTKAAKKAFASSVKDQRDAQQEFRDAFDDLGTPDIDGGGDVVKAFREQFKENDELTDGIEKSVADIDDDDDFLEAFLEIAADFDEPDFREKLADLAEDNDDVQDLIDAIDDNGDCSETIFDADAADDEPTQTSGSRTPTPAVKATSTARTPAPANSDAERWVGGICTSFTGWVRDIEKANNTFQGKLDSSTGSPAEVKALLIDFLRIGRQETVDLRSGISGLKVPNIKDAAKAQKIFTDTSNDLVGVFDKLIADAQKISTANAAQTRAEIDQLIDTIGTAFDEAAAGFDELDTLNVPEIEGLFDSRPECKELG